MVNSNSKFSKYIDWQKKQYSPKQKLLFLSLQEFFHLLVLPSLLFVLSKTIDTSFNISRVFPSIMLIYIGGAFFVVLGLSLSLWTRWIQFKLGQGTPAPKMPTQKLIIKGPYVYCRNPMILGDVIWLISLGIIFNSISFIIISILWFIAHLFYYKFIEEKELVARFGQEYTEYKKMVPFIIPSFKKQ